MAVQEDLMPESLLMRWLTFSKSPRILEEGYWTVVLRIGFLLFAAILFRLIVLGSELKMAWALVVLVFSLLVSLLLMAGLYYLTKIRGTARIAMFGFGTGALALVVILLSLF